MKKFLELLFISLFIFPNVSFAQSKREIKSLMDNFANYEVTTVKVAVDGTKFVKVWGYDSNAVDNNVEVYISFLRKNTFFFSFLLLLRS